MLLLMLIGGTVAMAALATPPWLAPALCYGAGLALTLALAARLTPASWWRRPTVRGLAIVAGGTWLCGSALALATGSAAPAATSAAMPTAASAITAMASTATAPAATAPPATRPAMAPQALSLASPALPPEPSAPAQPFRVHRSLNLRAGPDVGSARLAVMPAGARLTPTGARCGDWWQVQTDPAGGARRQTGWVSSLWLRQLAERQH